MEENKYSDELDIELIDDEDLDEGEDAEEVELDGYDEDDDEFAEEDDADEESEDNEADGEETFDEDGDNQKEASKEDRADEFTMRLLEELGYKGTYSEARAAFEAEHSGSSEKQLAVQSTDYDAIARSMLGDINREFGLKLTDFSTFEDLETFANLAIDDKVGAIKAFRATNHKLIDEAQKKAAISRLGNAKRNVPTLPKSDGGKGGVKGETISKRELRAYSEAYPELSRKEVIRLIKRVHKDK